MSPRFSCRPSPGKSQWNRYNHLFFFSFLYLLIPPTLRRVQKRRKRARIAHLQVFARVSHWRGGSDGSPGESSVVSPGSHRGKWVIHWSLRARGFNQTPWNSTGSWSAVNSIQYLSYSSVGTILGKCLIHSSLYFTGNRPVGESSGVSACQTLSTWFFNKPTFSSCVIFEKVVLLLHRFLPI